MIEQQEFVTTSVSEDVFSAIDMARKINDCVRIIGIPGIGKTAALNEYIKLRSGTFLLTAEPATAGSLNSVGMALSHLMTGSDARQAAIVWQELHRFVRDREGLTLIVDEAQNCNLKIIRQILTLNDASGLPIIFCGNANVLKRSNVHAADFDQISSRALTTCKVSGISDDDADRLTNTFGVEGKEAYVLMRRIAAKHHARGIVKVLRRARLVAGSAKTIRDCHIRDAAADMPEIETCF